MPARRERASPRLSDVPGQTKAVESLLLEAKWKAGNDWRQRLIGNDNRPHPEDPAKKTRDPKQQRREKYPRPKWVEGLIDFYEATGHPAAQELLRNLMKCPSSPTHREQPTDAQATANQKGRDGRSKNGVIFRDLAIYFRITGHPAAGVLLGIFRACGLHRCTSMTQFTHKVQNLRRQRQDLESCIFEAVDLEVESMGQSGSILHACKRVAASTERESNGTFAATVKRVQEFHQKSRRGQIDTKVLGHNRALLMKIYLQKEADGPE